VVDSRKREHSPRSSIIKNRFIKVWRKGHLFWAADLDALTALKHDDERLERLQPPKALICSLVIALGILNRLLNYRGVMQKPHVSLQLLD
jgi:hypothetical protein